MGAISPMSEWSIELHLGTWDIPTAQFPNSCFLFLRAAYLYDIKLLGLAEFTPNVKK